MRSVLLATLVLLALAAPAGADLSGPEIVGFLNAQRAAHGIPAGIVEDAALSDGCAKHNQWGMRNDKLQHDEEIASPGYTPEGDTAAEQSVLYRGGDPWSATNNPFETAPIHLAQLLAPRLDRMGASEIGGFGCATTLASRERPAPATDVVYTYPADNTSDWFAAQTAAEGPYTPGEQVGVAAGTKTGPYLYAFFDGPGLNAFSVASGATGTLTAPSGPVAIKLVDNTTQGLENYLPPGAMMIPVAPLAPFTRYVASISATVGGRAFKRDWAFTTGGSGRPFEVKATRSGRKVTLVFTSGMPLKVTVAFKKKVLKTKSLPGSGTLRVKLPRKGKVKLTVVAGGKSYTLRR
jgi:hypothetical protein